MDWNKTQQRLASDEANWGQIASDLGLERITIKRIAKGITPHPRVDTAQAIAAWYARQNSRASGRRRKSA